VQVLKSPASEARLLKQGVDIVASSPERFHDFMLAEIAKWAKVIAQANIRTEAS
jgi:tripartite-type tricarboxylate transporter receptor subunit TctC